MQSGLHVKAFSAADWSCGMYAWRTLVCGVLLRISSRRINTIRYDVSRYNGLPRNAPL